MKSYFDRLEGFFIYATTDTADVLCRNLIDSSYIDYHIETVLERHADEMDPATLIYIWESVCTRSSKELYDLLQVLISPDWEAIGLWDEIYCLYEAEIIGYYFSKDEITDEQKRLLDGYLNLFRRKK